MKLMIVEDDKALAKGIELALSEKENEITVCHDLKTAEEMWESENADLVILDVNLPDGSGYDFLAFVKESSKVPVILLTANDLEIDQVTGLSLGADDYITKPFGTSELLARIRTALRHSSRPTAPSAASSIYHAKQMKIDFDRRLVTVNGKEVHLTQIEYKILTLLAKNSGKVITYDTIMASVWGPYSDGNNRILRVNMANMRRKLENNPAAPEYIFTEVGIGYRMLEDESAW